MHAHFGAVVLRSESIIASWAAVVCEDGSRCLDAAEGAASRSGNSYSEVRKPKLVSSAWLPDRWYAAAVQVGLLLVASYLAVFGAFMSTGERLSTIGVRQRRASTQREIPRLASGAVVVPLLVADVTPGAH